MRQAYTIVRDLNRARGRGEPFWSIDAGFVGHHESIPDVDQMELDLTEATEIMEDDGQIIALAPQLPTQLIAPMAASIDASEGDSWGIVTVGADKSPFTGSGISVAVLDTGIDRRHAAFTGVELVEHDFTGTGAGDRNGHGTHCAGTVFGRDVGGSRIGIARGVRRAFIAKVLDDEGHGSTQSLLDGMVWASRQGARIISMSVTFDTPGYVQKLVLNGWPVDLATSQGLDHFRLNIRLFDSVMRMLQARNNVDGGSLVIAAAGNASKRDLKPTYIIGAFYPASAEGVVSVGAVLQGQDGFKIAPFSNGNVMISGPGVGIRSANVGHGLISRSGTSMACPHVAGVAALWWDYLLQSEGTATAADVAAHLVTSAQKSGFASSVPRADRGAGIVRAPQL